MKNKIAVLIKFNKNDLKVNGGSRFRKTLGNKEWWDNRVKIMKEITYPALTAQTFQDFDVIACFATDIPPGFADEMIHFLKSKGVFICWDGRRLKDFVEPFTFLSGKYFGKVENLILVNLDSDDVYLPEAFEKLSKVPVKDGQVCIYRNGYVYDISSDRMAEYKGVVPPPFYAVTYTNKSLGDSAAWNLYRNKFSLRAEHPHLNKCKVKFEMPDNLFCYIFHKYNVTSSWDNPHHKDKIKDEVVGSQKQDLVKQILRSA